MKFTLSWLREHLETQADAAAVSRTLTAIGLEVESCRALGAGLEAFTVAHILSAQPHPDADKLQVCRVATHSGERQIVCGAPNARAGLKVALADIGDVIPTSGLTIKPAKIRGVESAGMLCSAQELGLGNDSSGIIELAEDAAVGAKLVSVLGLDDVLFDVSITPNRGDCLGIYGIARDLAAAGLGTLKTQEPPTLLNTALAQALPLNITTEACRHFIAYRISNVRNAQSPAWLRQRLESVGMRSISVLVDITNYFTVAYGRPLHVYDASALKGGLTIRPATAQESFSALDEKTYTLPEGACVIADDAGVQALGGIIGGAASACQMGTTDVILEAAWFNPVAVAEAGRSLRIDSDARYRFERGIDPQSTAIGAARAAAMIVDLCGGQATGRSEAGSVPDHALPITYHPDMMTQRIGCEVSPARQRDILAALGFAVSEDWQVTAPSWRSDVEGSADITEEIARIHGYDALPEAPLPAAPLVITSPDMLSMARERLRARGMDEAVHFAFTSRPMAEALASAAPLVEVSNPISSELSIMRPHLFAGLLGALSRNIARGHRDLALYEAGAIFFGVRPEDQPVRIAGLRTGSSPMHWRDKATPVDIYDAKGDLIAVLEALGVATDGLMLSREVPPYYHPGKSARLSLGPKRTLGYFGQLHPAVLRCADIGQPVMGFECWLEAIPPLRAKRPAAFVPQDYQASRRDFAFIADASLDAGELATAIARADKQLIRDVTLFDIYQGSSLEAGKKSLAYAVTLQATDRTLTEEEINATCAAILRAAESKGAALR